MVVGARTLYLVRHGQRIDAVNKQWHKDGDNKYDPYLSQLGVWQAQRLGERLQGNVIDHIISSPYLRALQTAQAVAEQLGMPFVVEAGVGEWMGRAMMAQAPAIPLAATRAERFANMDTSYSSAIDPVWPETVPQVFDRYRAAMQHLLGAFSSNLLIVGHGRVVTGVPHVLTGKPEHSFKLELAGLTQLTWVDDAWQIQLNGDTTHLEEQPEPYFV